MLQFWCNEFITKMEQIMKTSSIIFTLVFSFSFVFTACEQDPQEVIETVIEVCEDEQKLANLKALFNPFHGAIYITDDFQERALEGLGLVPVAGTTDGSFEYLAFNLLGEPIPTMVRVELADLETIQSMSIAVREELMVIAEDEALAAEFLASSETYSGYRCTKVDVARNTRCHVFPGYSTDTRKFDRWLCRPASSSEECTEWMQTIGWSNRYNNESCSGTPQSTRIRALSCP